MKPYSQDLRQRILATLDAGFPQIEVAEMFAVSLSTIKRYLRARAETGHVEPKAIPGRPAVKCIALEQGFREQLEAYPEARREDHCQMWEEKTGIKVSTASISRARMAFGWTRKKSH